MLQTKSPRNIKSLLSHHLVHTPPPLPPRRPALHERANSAEVPLVAEEKRLLLAFTPELDGVGQGVDGLLVAADEGAAEVDTLEVVLFGLQVGDLADVVALRLLA